MNGRLKVAPDALLAVSSQLSARLNTMRNAFDRLKNTMRNTSRYWVGEAGDAHRELYQEQEGKIDEMLRRYQEHVTDLNAMAGVYEQAEQQATDIAEELPISAL